MACFLSSSFVQAVPTRIYNTTYPNKYYRPYGYQPNSNKLRSYNHDRHLRHNNNFIQTKSVFSDINALEKYTLNRNYNKESDLQRLQRLEMQAFGAIQSGDINSRYDNVRNAILSRPQNNYKSSLWRNIGNYFSGQMTGYTPSFDFNNDPFFSSNSNFVIRSVK